MFQSVYRIKIETNLYKTFWNLLYIRGTLRYKMNNDRVEIALFSLLTFILTIVIVITIINFIYLDNQSSTLYIQAQPISNNNNNNNNSSNDTNEQGLEKE